ncbi:unnamed protein product [Prorocentrum cordatum]|uniref:Uncharacterized protein n=1 Tax=Prorocentrum cordatum TaxID=2364126 RepID=A0ABN9WT29_9DINO|nr:unnamed protein product [Polarella glacialis]
MRPRRMIIEAPSGDARPKPPEYRPPRPAVAAPPMSPGGEGTRLLRREAEGGRGGALRWRAPEGPAGQAYPAVVPWDVLCLCVLLAPLLLAAAVSPVVALWALGTAASAGGGGAAYLAGLPGALRGAPARPAGRGAGAGGAGVWRPLLFPGPPREVAHISLRADAPLLRRASFEPGRRVRAPDSAVFLELRLLPRGPGAVPGGQPETARSRSKIPSFVKGSRERGRVVQVGPGHERELRLLPESGGAEGPACSGDLRRRGFEDGLAKAAGGWRAGRLDIVRHSPP